MKWLYKIVFRRYDLDHNITYESTRFLYSPCRKDLAINAAREIPLHSNLEEVLLYNSHFNKISI